MRKIIFKVKLQGKTGSSTKNDLLYRFAYIAKNFDKLIRFIKCFPNTFFTKQVLGMLLIFHRESFLEGLALGPLSLLWIHGLTWLEQFKQKISYSFDRKYIIFSAMTSSVTLTTHNCKSRAQITQVLNYLSNEVYVSSFCSYWFLTVWKD